MPILLRLNEFSNRARRRPGSQSSNETQHRVGAASTSGAAGTADSAAPTPRRTSQISQIQGVAERQDRTLQSRIHHPSGNTSEQTATQNTLAQQIKQLNFKEIFTTAYKKYNIKYLFPLMFIMVYMLFGAIIFYLLESGSDEERVAEKYNEYKQNRTVFLRKMEELLLDRNASRRSYRLKQINETIDFFEDMLEDTLGFKAVNESKWSLMSAMYYSGTLFTTIGYGDIACTTTAGRIMTVIYSCIGIPLMLITLNDLGKFLYGNINGVVDEISSLGSSLRARLVGGSKRLTNEDAKGDELVALERGDANNEASSLASEIGSEHDEDELEEEEKSPRMSVKVALSITIGWILFCSALFKMWEEKWTYGESCYFMFISLSTIGLGDVSVERRDMMVLCFVFVIIGLSLVSMSINVVQQAVEDFYIQLLMKLIMEYQAKLAAGGDKMGASVGMMRMFNSSATAKYLMPLLSKEKRLEAMEKVEKEAKNQGIEIPPILTDLDEKTGMPKILQIEEKTKHENAPPPPQLEEMVQKQLVIEEQQQLRASAEPPVQIITHEADAQTDIVRSDDKMEQTETRDYEEQGTQTVEKEPEEIEIPKVETASVECQTDEIPEVTVEQSVQETQTSTVECQDAETITLSARVDEASCQTYIAELSEQAVQTYIVESVDAEAYTEIETKNVRIQTPQPVIEIKTIQTEDLGGRDKSPSAMSSAKRRLRRAFGGKSKFSGVPVNEPAMSDWKEVEGETADEDEEEGSIESLHWDPVDGMHAEKQLPVKRLKSLFESSARGSFDTDRRRSQMHRKHSSFNRTARNEWARNRKSSE